VYPWRREADLHAAGSSNPGEYRYEDLVGRALKLRLGASLLDPDSVHAFCAGKVRKVDMRAESARLFGPKAPYTVEDT
jgi:hypothetical protein